MMRFTRIAFVILAASFAMTGWSAQHHHRHHRHGRSEIRAWQAWYNRGARLFTMKNMDKLSSYLTDDWQEIGPDGKVRSKKADLDKFKAQIDSMKNYRVQFHVLGVKHQGDESIVKAHFVFSGRMKAGDGRWHRMRDAGISDETWIGQGEDRKMKETHILQERFTIDGKPSSMPGM